jgi:hypothetical protein
VNDLGFAVIGFALGLLARPALDDLRWWIVGLPIRPWFPTRCVLCGRWTRRANTHLVEHQVAGRVRLCRVCYAQKYPGGRNA